MEVGDRVLIGMVRESSRKNYLKKFEEGTADLYYTGPSFPTSIALHNLHYFIPYFKGKGIRDVYETSNPQPPSKNEIELKEKEATQKKRLKEVKIATRRHKIPLPHNAT